MEERNWKYKITNRTGVIVAFFMLALFGGVTFWLYTAHNGAYILVGGLAALMAIAFVLSIYSALFFKVFVDKDGFYFQTAPGNGGGSTATLRSVTCGSAPAERRTRANRPTAILRRRRGSG